MMNRAGRSAAAGLLLSLSLLGTTEHAAHARPGGAQVIRGNVTFERHGNQTIIRASNGSIIQYLNFNIGPNEMVRFIQPGELSRVLNRITGAQPTLIQGRLLANGQVYIVNPAGVIFGNGAVVDVGGLYAAAGNLSNSRFINGVDKFTDLNGAVENDGTISARRVALMGETVSNHGDIRTEGPGGVIAMVAGNEVVLQQHGEHLSVKVDGTMLTNQARPQHGSTTPDMTASPGVENTGNVTADRGQVMLGAGDMYSLAVRNSGRISAARGDVTIAAADGLIHNTSTGTISADAVSGQAGTVTVQGPSVLNSGAITADADNGRAGSVEVTSQDHSFFTASSVVSASGSAGNASGGNVLIHSYSGHTALAHGSMIDVSGGAQGGDAGFAEISGDLLSFDGRVNLRARPGYEKGTVLFDPHNLSIDDTGGDDALLNDHVIHFDEPNPNQDVHVSDEALEAITGTIILQATGDITINHQVDLTHNNDVTLEALGGVFMLQSINGMHDFTALADADHNGSGDVFISAPLSIGGKAVFNGAHTFINTTNVVSGSTQEYLGPVDLCVDVTLTASQVHFHDTVNDTVAGEQSLTVNGLNSSDGIAIFGDQVGNESKLESLRVNGSSHINGGLVVTKFFQRYQGPVDLGSDAVLTSTDAGEIRFGGTLNGNRNLLVETAGLTRFDGRTGGQAPLVSVTTDAPGTTRLAGDMDAGAIAFNDQVILARSVTLNGDESVEFGQALAGGGHDLIINSPLTGFHGDATDLDLLQTDAAGHTDIEADITGNKLDFNDNIKLLSDSILTGHTFIDFDKTVDGRFNLTTNSDHVVRFGGDVGGNVALQSLTANVGAPDLLDENLIIFDGNLVHTAGDISFNPAGRSAPAMVATIAGRNFGGLTIRSGHGDILMGPNEKLTALGNLKILAHNGSVTLGDVNVFGSVLIDSPDIMLRRREGGQVLNSHGELVDDDQADYVVWGQVKVTSTPTLIDSGPMPLFALRVIENFTGPIGNFLRVAFQALSEANFVYKGKVLDLGPPSGPMNPPTDLATALTSGPAQIHDHVPLDPFAMRAMERLAIYMRALRPDELRDKLAGREMYDDSPEQSAAAAEERAIAVNRLRRDSVLRTLDAYSAMFIKQDVPGRTRPPLESEDQSPYIKASLAKAWQSYLDREAASGGGQLDPARFRAFLESQPEQAEALTYLNGLRGMFNEIRIMGATRLEQRNSVNGILRPIVPDNMNQQQLEDAIAMNRVG